MARQKVCVVTIEQYARRTFCGREHRMVDLDAPQKKRECRFLFYDLECAQNYFDGEGWVRDSDQTWVYKDDEFEGSVAFAFAEWRWLPRSTAAAVYTLQRMNEIVGCIEAQALMDGLNHREGSLKMDSARKMDAMLEVAQATNKMITDLIDGNIAPTATSGIPDFHVSFWGQSYPRALKEELEKLPGSGSRYDDIRSFQDTYRLDEAIAEVKKRRREALRG